MEGALHRFVRLLRLRGMRISTAEAIDAFDAAAAVGLSDRSALEAALGEPESVKLAWRPQTEVDVGAGEAEQLIKLVDALEDDDDVQTVWGNYQMSDEVMAGVA